MIWRKSLEKFAVEFAALEEQLLLSRKQLLNLPYPFADNVAETVGLDAKTIVNYWETIDYRLENEHLQGLKLFFKLCVKYNLLDENPELTFID